MKLFSYIITEDTGFSPNPFWGYCTLADCKPVIRRTANKGDWIVGLSSKSAGHKIVYAMEVQEILTYDEYYRDVRFQAKIPDFNKEYLVYKCGDNIYKPMSTGGYLQLQSMHSNGEKENLITKQHDISGKNVLISKKFCYFGADALELCDELHLLKVARGHKNRFPPEIISYFLELISKEKRGLHAPPSKWPKGDESWRPDYT
jgi:hypothetical protein